jgi:hypothetical protein
MANPITIPAPISRNLALAMRISGIVCLGTAALGVVALLEGGLPVSGLSGFCSAAFLPGLIGVSLLSMPDKLNKQRAKLLDKRAAAFEKGDPTYFIEKPSDPDLVRMSLLFGILTLVTVPILFGPAAVVTGIIALNQGHWKALIGVVLGVVGFAVWGVVFYYLVLS